MELKWSESDKNKRSLDLMLFFLYEDEMFLKRQRYKQASKPIPWVRLYLDILIKKNCIIAIFKCSKSLMFGWTPNQDIISPRWAKFVH